MTEEISLDQLFAQQQKAADLFTIEPVQDKPDLVKVTPWAAGPGCHCSGALMIAKDAIASATKMNQTHDCCGKRLEVVGVKFKEGAHVEIADVLKQSAAAATHAHASHSAFNFAFAQQPVSQSAPSMTRSLLTTARGMLPMRPTPFAPCVPVCTCWPDGCLCYYDCTGGGGQQ